MTHVQVLLAAAVIWIPWIVEDTGGMFVTSACCTCLLIHGYITFEGISLIFDFEEIDRIEIRYHHLV